VRNCGAICDYCQSFQGRKANRRGAIMKGIQQRLPKGLSSQPGKAGHSGPAYHLVAVFRVLDQCPYYGIVAYGA
jgi:hypothetical protein